LPGCTSCTSFAGLHPIIGLTEHLSHAQRRAIDAAFGVSGEVEPDPFRVALANEPRRRGPDRSA